MTAIFLADGKEVEIVPFREPQIEQYVTTWFTNAEGHLSNRSVSCGRTNTRVTQQTSSPRIGAKSAATVIDLQPVSGARTHAACASGAGL